MSQTRLFHPKREKWNTPRKGQTKAEVQQYKFLILQLHVQYVELLLESSRFQRTWVVLSLRLPTCSKDIDLST